MPSCRCAGTSRSGRDLRRHRYFTFRYACECGETYPGALYISYTAEDGETGTLTASKEGVVDYSMLEYACRILIETETEILYEFDLPAVQPPEEPEEPDGGEGEKPETPDDGKDEQPPIPDEGTGDNEQDKPGNENDGQAENKGNAPTLAILFVLLGVLAACGVAVFIAKKRKNKTEQK